MSNSLRPHTVRGILQARILEWGTLSLLQGIFPTQDLNWGLLHCRQIFYQLCYQGSPLCFQVYYKGYNLRIANGRDDRQGMEKGVWSPHWAHVDVFITW